MTFRDIQILGGTPRLHLPAGSHCPASRRPPRPPAGRLGPVARQIRSASLCACLQAVLVHGVDMAILASVALADVVLSGAVARQPPPARSGALRAGSGRRVGGMAGCSPKKRMNSALASGPCASV